MKRVVLALAAAALAGCGSGTPSARSVVVYWDFLRHTQTAQGIKYDTVDPGGGDDACHESGVDYVQITDEGGRVVNPEQPFVRCVYLGVHGAQINFVRRGGHTWTLTGYRGDCIHGGTCVPTFVATKQFTVSGDTRVDATLEGIPDDLDVNVGFLTSSGAGAGPTCEAAGVQFLGYSMYDGAGTKVAEGEVPCKNPPGFSFRVAAGTGIDRDTYSLRLVAYPDANPSTPATYDDQRFPQCQATTFDHVGNDVAGLGWNVALYRLDMNARPCP